MTGPARTDSPLAGHSLGNASIGATSPLLYWESPSGVGPLLIWEQPHVIWMAELQRQVMATTSEEQALRVVSRLWPVVKVIVAGDFVTPW